MELDWRGNKYEFFPKSIKGGKDKWTNRSNINGNIYGADTESVQLDDRYECMCFQFSSESQGEDLIYVDEKVNVLPVFLEWFLENYEDELLEKKHHFLYLHNLAYDWLQLIKNDPVLLEMAKIGVTPDSMTDLYTIRGFKITLKKHGIFTGTSPRIILRFQKGRQAFTLNIHDTFSFFPTSLEGLAKDLKLPLEKMERQEDLGQVDYRKLPKNDERKKYFEKYSRVDGKIARLAGEKIRELHILADMTKIHPSSPKYAISLLYSGMDDDQYIVTGSDNPKIMQLVVDTYKGGRTGGVYHGQVEDMSVLDFHSSYPGSMLSLPSFSQDMVYANLEGEELEFDNVIEILKETGNAFLLVSGTETDIKYPSLLRTLNNKLTPVYGDFERVATTGYEFLVGVQSGGLTNIVIHECVVLFDTEDEPFLPFKEFAIHAYKRKAAAVKGEVEYTSSKLALNASYGKLIESNGQTLIGASIGNDYLPYMSNMEKDFGSFYYTEYISALEKGYDEDKFYEWVTDQVADNFPDEYETMELKMFSDFLIGTRTYGRFAVPAAASLITGCSRARLLAAMKALGAVYWDTDSVFIPNLEADSVNDKLLVTSEWLPMDAVPVQVGDELGELDFEMMNGFGYLAGTKRYYLRDELFESNVYDEKGKRLGVEKRATHGIPALPREQVEDVIRALALGSDYSYDSKPKPLKAKESKRKEDIGSFMSRHFRSQFHLDDRLDWVEVDGGWVGQVKDIHTMEETE